MSAPVVTTTGGKIKGKICKTEKDFEFYAYKGIPFAKPPVGELRFSEPQQPDPWDGVRDGTKDSNICAQIVSMTTVFRGDEDCLYLSVFTPRLSQNTPLPVMVNIHGGGFVSGSGGCDEYYGPDYMVEKDVVIVSFNYRLGILGFLALDTKEAPGNMGLKDQVAALKWVQNNIHNFGGDPNNVTIVGISAGGASVEYLLLSPMAKGLFHKAISQSGSSLNNWAQNKNIKELAAKIPQAKGESADMDDKQLLQYLKDMPIDDLISLSDATVKATKHKGGLFFGFVPTIEKKGDWEQFLSDDSYKLLSTGNINKVPLISGFCTHEGMITSAFYPALFEDVAKEKNFIDHFPFTIDESNKFETMNRLQAVYLDGRSKNEETDEFAIDFYSDTDFIGGVYTAATLVAQSNVPVYLYSFAYDGNMNYVKKAFTTLSRKGACHGEDFTMTIKIPAPMEKNSTDEAIQDQVVTMWTNFAKLGNPTPKKDDVINTIWEPFTKDKPSYLLIDHPISMQTNFSPDRTRLYSDYYEKRSE